MISNVNGKTLTYGVSVPQCILQLQTTESGVEKSSEHSLLSTISCLLSPVSCLLHPSRILAYLRVMSVQLQHAVSQEGVPPSRGVVEVQRIGREGPHQGAHSIGIAAQMEDSMIIPSVHMQRGGQDGEQHDHR